VRLTPFPAGYMCGAWVALEDVKDGSGELVVYPKNHRLPRIYRNTVGCPVVKDGQDWEGLEATIIDRWRSMMTEGDFEKFLYRPKIGTVLIWYENLTHGGSKRIDESLSRRSIVSHCFADGAAVFFDSSGMPGIVSG